MPIPPSLIERLLAEDVPHTDLTTEALGIGAIQGRMEFRARGAMTVAGIDIAGALISHAGAEASVLIPPGARAEAGDLLLSAVRPGRRAAFVVEGRANADRNPFRDSHRDARARGCG